MQRQLNEQTTYHHESVKRYRFGFVLSVAMGNMTRYLNFRKYAERDPEVDCVWAPVKHFIASDEPNPFRHLPEPLYTRAVVLYLAYPVLKQMNQLDVIMIHLFEAYVLSCLRSLFWQQPLIAWNHDDPPMVDAKTHSVYSQYAHHANKQTWRRRVRLEIDRWCASRTSLFFPWSNWAGDILVDACKVPKQTVYPLHVGIDLETWSYTPRSNTALNTKPKILFVGGDFVRKGGDLLLKVFNQQFADRAELHLVTKEPPTHLSPNVHIYTDINPKDHRLHQLYSQADLFVLPTTADLSSFASLEAMAAGCPVISTKVGGIQDIVQPGKTGFLIPVGDASALETAMQTLLDDATLRQRMGAEGRAVVEQNFNSAINVPRILEMMKQAVNSKQVGERSITHYS